MSTSAKRPELRLVLDSVRADADALKRNGQGILASSMLSIVSAVSDATEEYDTWLGDSDVRVLTKSYLRNRPDDLKHVVSGLSLPARTEPKSNTSGNETATAPTRGAEAKNRNR